jgi:beta-lactamase class A
MHLSFIASLLLALAVSVPAAATSPTQKILDGAIQEVFVEFPALKSNQLAATFVLLPEKHHAARASYRGGQPIYPASVVKLFYLVAAHRWMEDGCIKDMPELRRAMRDMIVDSGNDPTHYVVDLLTDTTSGPELPEVAMTEWGEKRNAVNRYFRSLGYENINVNQKPWGEGPYGRERAWVGTNYHNRNALTTDATARLFVEIAGGLCVSGDRSRQMMELLKREFKPGAKDDQGANFTGKGLPDGAKLWSKAGWTSTTRHDAAYVELPGGGRFVLVTFTTGHSNNRDIIPSLTRRIVAALPRPHE